jgi:enediyne biosynthesis protein E4
MMVNGMYPYSEAADPFVQDRVRFWRNVGETPLEECSLEAGLDAMDRGKAIAVFDYDLDGDLDVFIVHNAASPRLYRNDGPVGNYLRVRAEGRGAREGGTNRHGFGVRVDVRVTTDSDAVVRELNGGFGFLSQSENVAHFGLGTHSEVYEVRVHWPVTGLVSVLRSVAANQVLVVREPEG